MGLFCSQASFGQAQLLACKQPEVPSPSRDFILNREGFAGVPLGLLADGVASCWMKKGLPIPVNGGQAVIDFRLRDLPAGEVREAAVAVRSVTRGGPGVRFH